MFGFYLDALIVHDLRELFDHFSVVLVHFTKEFLFKDAHQPLKRAGTS